jgi:hypothetical protein
MWVDAQLWGEHVEHASFVDGVRRENVGLTAALVWTP